MPKRRQSPYCRSGKRKKKQVGAAFEPFGNKSVVLPPTRRRGRQHQESDGRMLQKRSWDLLAKSLSGPTKTKNLNQDHVKPSQLAVALFPLLTPFLLFMTVILVNYSDFICSPETCSAKQNEYNSFSFTATASIDKVHRIKLLASL